MPSVGFGLGLNSVAEQEIDEISSEILSEIEKSSSKEDCRILELPQSFEKFCPKPLLVQQFSVFGG